jgi:hypothetical protein
MNGHGTIGTLPDLGAVHARQQDKERVPTYDPGSPEFAKQVRVALGPNVAPSFTDALDRAAVVLDHDGGAIESVSQCAMLGIRSLRSPADDTSTPTTCTPAPPRKPAPTNPAWTANPNSPPNRRHERRQLHVGCVSVPAGDDNATPGNCQGSLSRPNQHGPGQRQRQRGPATDETRRHGPSCPLTAVRGSC